MEMVNTLGTTATVSTTAVIQPSDATTESPSGAEVSQATAGVVASAQKEVTATTAAVQIPDATAEPPSAAVPAETSADSQATASSHKELITVETVISPGATTATVGIVTTVADNPPSAMAEPLPPPAVAAVDESASSLIPVTRPNTNRVSK
ncbi:mucin-7-like [Schistocerca serialis cubense]|uniref:mucin-7-like n=1 Tax=Schistocerca serialis cubense TaxID=2023355 RepID=UPI00214E511E|nr:mucin-7-like [Schistocerca serialis cubense]